MKRIEKIFKGWNIWKKRISAAMACIVVFVTVYALVLPAITLDQNTADQDEGIGPEEFDDFGQEDFDPEDFDPEDFDPEDFDPEDFGAEDFEEDSQNSVLRTFTLEWPDAETKEALRKAAEAAAASGEEKEEINYTVTASFDEFAGFPEDVSFQAAEIEKDTKEYEEYYKRALDAVRKEAGEEALISYARFFDIAFKDGAEEIEPEGPVSILIEYDDEKDLMTEETGDLSVLHFAKKDPKHPDFMENVEITETDGQVESIGFESETFSVYGVVKTGLAESKEEAEEIEETKETEEAEAAEETEKEEDGEQYSFSHSMLGGESIMLSELLEKACPDQEDLQIGNVTDVAEGDEVSDSRASRDGDFLQVSYDMESGDYEITASPDQGNIEGKEGALTVLYGDEAAAVIEIVVSGQAEVDAGTAVITSADGIYLPDSAEGKAEELAEGEMSPEAEEAADTGSSRTVSRVFDISLNLTEEEQAAYEGGFLVNLTLPDEVTGRDFHLYHIHDGLTEELAIEKTGTDPDETGLETVSAVQFVTESFSEFLLQYTVDFHWEVNGKTYEFSMPGGGYVSFTDLVDVLGIIDGTNAADGEAESVSDTSIMLNNADVVSDTAREFVSNVEKVEFSSPELVYVSKVEADTTVGAIKDGLDFACENSAELTEEDIAEINSTEVRGGDWALISVKAFDTEETLTVTMKNGEIFRIRVTDAQISAHVITADGKDYVITVIYDDAAQIPKGAELKVREITDADAHFDDYLQRASGEDKEADAAEISGEADAEAEQESDEISEGAANSWSAKPVTVTGDPEYARFFDIEIQAGGKKVEPKAEVSVQISLANVPENVQSDLEVVHFGKGGDELMTVDTNPDAEENIIELSFVTDEFSVYAIASRGDGTDVNIFNKDYVLVHNNVALSPEPNPSNSNHLRGIAVTVTGDTISTGETSLPAWRLERYWDNTARAWRYLLSTMVDGSKMYLNLENQSNGRAYVSSAPQPMLLDTQNNDHYECRFRVAQSPNAALDLDYNNIENGFHAYVNGSNVYFRLYELGDEIYHKVTVHFVDRGGNPVPGVTYSGQYTDQVVPKDNSTFEIRYDWNSQEEAIVNLKSDFAISGLGYTYASSHLAGTGSYAQTYGGLTIDEKLHSTGSSLEYYSDRGINHAPSASSQEPYYDYPYDESRDVGNVGYLPPRIFDFNSQLKVFDSSDSEVVYSEAGVDKDVYVILDPVTSGNGSGGSSSGGSGSGSGSGEGSQDVEDPNFHKQLDKNPDGTYTLSLSVTGHAKNTETQPKANILLVVDTSSSMTGTTDTGTRLSDTKEELKLLGGLLLDKNKPGETEHSVELAMVSFDGDTTDELDWTHEKSVFTSCVDSNSHLVTHQGTDWEDGLKRALELANIRKAAEPDQPVFIVFFTDGEPSQYTNFHGRATNNNGYDHWYSHYLSREAAKDEMRAIVQAGHRLYGVYAFNKYGTNPSKQPPTPYNNEKGEDLLHHAIQYGYNTTASLEGSYFHYAENRTELNNAFAAILKSINESVGFKSVVMNDSITSLTSVGATLENGNTHGFTYTRSGGKYGADGQEWTDAPQVTYTEASGDELAKVTWNLGTYGTLEDGVTYTVSFTVWPNQEAFDYVTKLNNGFITIDQIPEADRSCFLKNETTGKYEVRTNPESGPDGSGKVTNEIDYTKEHSVTVTEKPAGASTDPNNPVVETSGEGVWPKTVTKTWYEPNEEDGTWTKHVTTEVVTAFGPPDKNMVLDDSIFKIQKVWQVSREEEMIYYLYDPTKGLPIENHKYLRFNVQEVDNPASPVDFARVDMGYDEALSDYRWADTTHTVTVHDIPHQVGRIWEKNLDISYGQMISPANAALRHLYLGDPRYIPIYTSEAARQAGTVSYYVLEKGHDYKIAEPALDYRFEFQTEIYHPMLVNGTPSNVKIRYAGNDEYGILEEAESDSVLKGRNVLRGALTLHKVVIGPDGETVADSDAVFDFKVKLTNNDEPGPFYDDPVNVDEHNIPWYGVKINREGEYLFYHEIEPNPDGSYNYTDELHACVDGNYNNGLRPGFDGNRMIPDEDTPRNVVTADIKIRATDEWNIANIPSGTTYEIEEVVTKGYEFEEALEVGSNPEIKVVSPADPVITGSIGLNTTKEVVFKNQQRLAFDITKVDVRDLDDPDAEPLQGAAFKLEKYKDDTFRFVDNTWGTNGAKTAAETAENPGRFHFEGLKVGYYKLIETAWPDGYCKQKTDPMIQVVFDKVEGKFQMILLVYDDNDKLVPAANNRDGNVKIETIQRPVQSEESEDTGDGEDDTGTENGDEQETEPVMENVLMLTYGNIPGATLPNTGGPGTRLFTVLGSILILGAGVLLWRRRRLI